MAMVKDSAQVGAKWKRNYSGSTQTAMDGVNRVTEAPGQKAAAQRQLWAQKMASGEVQDKWARRVAAVPLESWKAAYRDKGIQRMAQGAVSGEGKMQSFMSKFLPHVATGVAALPPRGDLETNLQRANSMARHNAGYRS